MNFDQLTHENARALVGAGALMTALSMVDKDDISACHIASVIEENRADLLSLLDNFLKRLA